MPRRPRKRANGAGSYQQRGSRHIVQSTVEGLRVTRSFKTKEEALAELGRPTAAALSDLTLAQHAEKWFVDRRPRKSYYQDLLRWTNHWILLVGHLLPDQLTVSVLKDALRALRAKGLSNSSIRLCVALVSALYSDLVEEGLARANPTRLLSKKTRLEFLKPAHDPRKVPFFSEAGDSLRVHRWLAANHPTVALAYAIGAFAGLRTGEVRALQWSAIDLTRRIITVTHSVEKRTGRPCEALSSNGLVPTKSGLARVVPITDLLLPILLAAPPRGGQNLVCPGSAREDGLLPFLSEETIGEVTAEAMDALDLPPMTFYQGTRHSYASQWVLHGGNIHTLSTILGHSTTQVTEKYYVHLVPGRFTDADRGRVFATAA